MSLRSELSERHLKVLDFVRMHQGCSKETVVRGLKEIISRIPVLNILIELEENGLIVARKNKPNSQIYHLYINCENDLVSLLSRAQQFKSIYSVLLEIGKKRIEEMEMEMTISNYARRRKYSVELELLEALLYVNRYFVNSYMVFLQFNSHDRVKDEETLKRIHLTISKVTREIQDRLLDTIAAASSFL